MKYIAVSNAEWTYPDMFEYKTGAAAADLHAARGTLEGLQIILKDVPENADITCKANGALAAFGLEAYEMVPVYVESTIAMTEDFDFFTGSDAEHKDRTKIGGCPDRWAPYWVYDCIKPLGNKLTPKFGTAGLYFCFDVKNDVAPGAYAGTPV